MSIDKSVNRTPQSSQRHVTLSTSEVSAAFAVSVAGEPRRDVDSPTSGSSLLIERISSREESEMDGEGDTGDTDGL